MFARASGERLSLFVPAAGLNREDLFETALSAGVAADNIDWRVLPGGDTTNFLAALDPFRERIIILPWQNDGNGRHLNPAEIVSRRHTPVILVDPSATLEP